MHQNVESVLAKAGITFRERRHADLLEPVNSPADFARQLQYELERITKTLLVRSSVGAPFALVVAPVTSKLKFAVIANSLGVKRVEVASEGELSSVTGYPRSGVSPLGVDGVAVFVDESLLAFSTILVGAGAVGVEIEIAPADLVKLTEAKYLQFAQ